MVHSRVFCSSDGVLNLKAQLSDLESHTTQILGFLFPMLCALRACDVIMRVKTFGGTLPVTRCRGNDQLFCQHIADLA